LIKQKHMPLQIISLTLQECTEEALHTLQQGGILLFPTETVYGVGADSAQPEAIERLYEMKGRPKEKPFQWLVSSKEIAHQNSVVWTKSAERLASAFWPGPLTLVVPGQDGTIGWRVPKHDWLLELLRKLNRPLVSTSANLAGESPALSCEQGVQKLGRHIQLAVDGGDVLLGKPSTVVKVVADRVDILREGAISREAILDALK